MTDYLSSAVAAFERRHGSKPVQIVVGLAAAIVLAGAKQLSPVCAGVGVEARPLREGESPVQPGAGTRLFVSYEGLRGGLEVCELA